MDLGPIFGASNGPSPPAGTRRLTLVAETPVVDDDKDKIGFTADVVMRLSEREDEEPASPITVIGEADDRGLAESA